jgi:hypothetical protein
LKGERLTENHKAKNNFNVPKTVAKENYTAHTVEITHHDQNIQKKKKPKRPSHPLEHLKQPQRRQNHPIKKPSNCNADCCIKKAVNNPVPPLDSTPTPAVASTNLQAQVITIKEHPSPVKNGNGVQVQVKITS